MATPMLTLYTSKTSPWALRVEICLAQAQAEYKRYEMDLLSKRPEWYTTHVNLTGQAPAVAYGGPDVPPDQPSPESTKLRESAVLMEFVADLYPDSGLLPSDPVGRAKARFFVDVVNTKLGQVYVKHFYTGGASPLAAVIPGLEAVEALLPTDKVFAVGDNFTIADAAVVPFLLHLGVYISLRDEEGVGAALRSEKLTRLSKYIQALKEHPSVKSSWDEPEKYLKQVLPGFLSQLA